MEFLSVPGSPYEPTLFQNPTKNGLLLAKGGVIHDMGHHLTSHPTDMHSIVMY